MATTPSTPLSAKPVTTRWLWTVRILVVLSIVFIVSLIFVGMADALSSAPESPWGALLVGALLLALPPALPYLWILVRLGGKARQKGLALSVVIGAVAFLVGVLILSLLAKPTPDRCGTNLLVFPIVGLFVLLQAVLVPVAIKTNYMLQRATGGGPAFGSEIRERALHVGLPLLIPGILIAIALPNLLRWRPAPGQASPVGSLRTINTAEITYASTYNAGYSKALTDLQPPAASGNPTATAAGLIDSVLASGVKSGYRFEYKPGPAENGRIETYTITSSSIESGCPYAAGSYFTDQSGVIRETKEDRPATAQDPPLGQ